MEKSAKNFAIYVALHSGQAMFFCEEPSFYGCVKDFDKKQYRAFCDKYYIKTNPYFEYADSTDEEVLKQILQIGVDFDQTEEFTSDSVALFTDTFHDPEYEDIMKGTLVLKDGQRIMMFARCNIDDRTFKLMEKFNNFSAM